MTWAARHEGSPQHVAGLSTQAVVSGLLSGQWATTDEVRGEADDDWQPLENHPAFATIAADVEPPPREEPEDETRLDMNPLIDVALVLLIFFILTTTYETIRKVLDMPGGSESTAKAGVQKSQLERMKEFVIRVNARMENGRPLITVEDQPVGLDDLAARFSQFIRTSTKRQILLDAQGLEWGTVIQIMDAARAAGVEKTLMATHAKPKN